MPTVYPSLSIPAPARLAMFKREAAQPNWARPLTWRDVRFATLRSASGFDQGLNDGAPVWYSHNAAMPRERFADECEGGPDHRGWYTQADGMTYVDDTGLARGIVARLSHGRFISGYWWGDNGERVYFPEVYGDERKAARAADSHAETFAETAREDSERFNRMQNAETACDEAAENLRDCWALRRMGRRDSDDVRDAAQALREAREELETATREYEGA